jgi:dCMP deaminase
MHDIEPDRRKRKPPLIVLGLTGRVGSGCSWISNRIFDDPDNPNRGQGNELLKVLKFVRWITQRGGEGFIINWKGLNKEVDITYKKIDSVDKEIKDLDTSKEDKVSKNIRLEQLKDQLKKDLEIRESIKALDELKKYYGKDSHIFRTISVSDLIVFRALMVIEKENFNLNGVEDKDKAKKYEQFVRIARKHINNNQAKARLREIDVDGYGDFYKSCYEWKNKDKLNKLGEAFDDIHRVTMIIKKDFRKKYPCDYSEVMQDFGDNIRHYDEPFGQTKPRRPEDNAYKLAKGVAQMIYILYKMRKGAFFVVDCLRNPYEVIYLRREFANFFLLSLHANKQTRERRFIKKVSREWGNKFKRDKLKEIFEEIDKRDSGKNVEGKEVLYKQNVIKCMQISHIAISNEREWPEEIDITKINTQEIEKAIETVRDFCRKPLRILCLILSPGCTKPNDDEICMNMAYTMAVKSNCISRQVGAVIIGPKGYMVGAGWNDVGEGKISCGIRAIRDLECKEFIPHVRALLDKSKNEKIRKKDIKRLISRLLGLVKGSNKSIPHEQFCFCFKDEMAKKVVTSKIKEALAKINEISEEKGKIRLRGNEVGKLVEQSQVHQLEYCLALHAEENAIIQISKIGGMGLKGGTIYTTAQPCSLCAKKIQQIGLRKVVYTVAYPESLPEVYMKGVDLHQFEGVKPRAYIKLFMPHHDQKEWQELESQSLVPMI